MAGWRRRPTDRRTSAPSEERVGDGLFSEVVRVRRSILLLGLPLATGAGLVITIVSGYSLLLAVAVLVTAGLAVWLILVPRLPVEARARLRRRAWAGVRAGFVATLAYDAVRYGVVSILRFSFQPFHVIPLFGQLFLGPDAPFWATVVVGLTYHILNGTGFGVAYTLAFRRPHPVTGMAWGVLLELFMATLYPAWLRIQQLGEFLQVSAVGHLCYGAVLGLVAGRLLATASTAVRSGNTVTM